MSGLCERCAEREARSAHDLYCECCEQGSPDDPAICPSCGYEAEWEDCSECGGEGGFDGEELDPCWYEEGELVSCHLCDGTGGFWFCPTSDCPSARIDDVVSEGATDDR